MKNLATVVAVMLTALPLIAAPRAAAELTPVQIEGFDGAARRGSVVVPVSYADPAGATTEVGVLVLEARSGKSAPDPIVYLVGGPGRSATDGAKFFNDSLRTMQQDRDLVLIDIRGTGRSSPVVCQLTLQERLDALLAFQSSPALEQCLVTLEPWVEQLDTKVYARDIESVRAQLGAERLNLVGVSYGTRLAAEYARLFPRRTRSLTLRGLVAPDRSAPAMLMEGGRQALDAVLGACQPAGDCVEAKSKLEINLAKVIAQLEDSPRRVQAGSTEVMIDGALFEGLLRLMLYDSRTAAAVGLVIDRAASGDFAPFAQAVGASAGLSGQLSVPVFLSVLCREEMVGWEAPADSLFSGAFAHRQATELCRLLPPVQRSRSGLWAADIPSLVLSGDKDPATPVSALASTAGERPQLSHVVVPGLGHFPTWTSCFSQLMADFIDRGSVQSLDLGCAEKPFATQH